MLAVRVLDMEVSPMTSSGPGTLATDTRRDDTDAVVDTPISEDANDVAIEDLIEEVSIDGMCGVY
jgi:mycofactocin precursor